MSAVQAPLTWRTDPERCPVRTPWTSARFGKWTQALRHSEVTRSTPVTSGGDPAQVTTPIPSKGYQSCPPPGL
ncbi:unnamed protein product [Sphagnum balticum]